MAKKPPIKRRDAAATRASILEAARQRFIHESFNSVSLREIAGDAGVDAALISRYFGGKEGLFVEVLVPEDASPVPAEISADQIPEFLCDLLLSDDEKRRDHRMEMFIIMLRSVSSPVAGEIIRKRINADMIAPITATMRDESAAWRANMMLAMMMGVSLLGTIMQSDGLTCMTDHPENYRDRLISLFRAILKL